MIPRLSRLTLLLVFLVGLGIGSRGQSQDQTESSGSTAVSADGSDGESSDGVKEHLDRVRRHTFHPLNDDGGMTIDRELRVHGIADLDNRDGRTRLLAIAGLVRALPGSIDAVIAGLSDEDLHVRQVAAAALGIARMTESSEDLERLLMGDPSPVVRSQAAISLGQMESSASMDVLHRTRREDPSRDVRHQCELAIDQIEKEAGATDAHRESFREMNEEAFGTVEAGDSAPDFELLDADGRCWRLGEANSGRWVVLIWIFADWCPVCHGEFRDLIDSKDSFESAGVAVATLECHDRYRCRVMAGRELAPEYWFEKKAPQPLYKSGVWWPHLVDQAGTIAARYGAEPMSFAVHAEYINRPTTVIIDPSGTVRFAYRGTYWGDRPTVEQTLEMIRDERFDFEHPNRRGR